MAGWQCASAWLTYMHTHTHSLWHLLETSSTMEGSEWGFVEDSESSLFCCRSLLQIRNCKTTLCMGRSGYARKQSQCDQIVGKQQRPKRPRGGFGLNVIFCFICQREQSLSVLPSSYSSCQQERTAPCTLGTLLEECLLRWFARAGIRPL